MLNIDNIFKIQIAFIFNEVFNNSITDYRYYLKKVLNFKNDPKYQDIPGEIKNVPPDLYRNLELAYFNENGIECSASRTRIDIYYSYNNDFKIDELKKIKENVNSLASISILPSFDIGAVVYMSYNCSPEDLIDNLKESKLYKPNNIFNFYWSADNSRIMRDYIFREFYKVETIDSNKTNFTYDINTKTLDIDVVEVFPKIIDFMINNIEKSEIIEDMINE